MAASGGPDDRELGDVCGLCGASTSESAFAFGTAGTLCYECSIARGGRFDAGRDRWDPPPDVADLPDEAYGAAPHEKRRRE